MGALQYVPEFDLAEETQIGDFDDIARECSRLLATNQTDRLDELFRLGGSSGGARPKILTEVNGQPWLIKFPSKEDDDAIGLQEYEYALCAKACGIEMAETRLFPSRICSGYFGTRRFDRALKEDGKERRMGKLRPERPTLAQKKAISRAGLLPDNWMVLDDGSVSMVILSRKSGQRRVISK